ncbi:MAG: succinate dehydrogenase [Candidatus Binataceae bacterium]
MANGAVGAVRPADLGVTTRKDAWWVQPLVVFLALSAFVVYATWAAFQGNHYRFGPYLSPFYSPEIFGDPKTAWFGAKPGWWPVWLVFSPALLILPFPAGFRVTCYYYRGAYYKAFWADPPSCTVKEPRSHYRGESSFPLIIQNVHRYFLYIALLFILVLAHDAWDGVWFADAAGVKHFGMGVGSLVLIANVVLLGGYTFGCHSLRHLVGGKINKLSECPMRSRLYGCASMFNARHMGWAWPSLVFVAFTDVYIRLCSMGIITDWRFF